MRLFLGLFMPLAIQVVLFVIVFAASRGGGSFMGLLAMPAAPVALVALVCVGWTGARSQRPIGAVVLTSLAIAVVPPVLLLVFRALEG